VDGQLSGALLVMVKNVKYRVGKWW